MDVSSAECAIDGNTTQTNIILENHLQSHPNKANGDNDMHENFPNQNGLLESCNTTHNEVMMNGVFSEPLPKVQPFVEKVSFEKHSLLKSGSNKRKRDSFSIDTRNLQEVKHSCIELRQSPSSPTWSSVTVLKYQDGEFVKIHSPSSSYNSSMSLQDMRKAIIASLESFISQPNIDFECHMESVSPVNVSPQETSPNVEEISMETFAEPPEKNIKVPTCKEIKHSSFSQDLTRKVKSPNKESIKFANRQKELMRMKKEMKNKLKNENIEDSDEAKLAIWGRTVGVSCTMCGKHVQKSYGCFRRDNAPEKLKYLFTPGMNRIKICRRCLPYKKQTPDGEPENKPGKKLGGKVQGNNSKKSNNVIKNSVNKALLKKHFPHKKPVSTSTLDAIQRKLTTSNETADPKVTPNTQRKIVLGQPGKGDAMEYIKKLAENLQANYNKEAEPAEKQIKTPLSQQHVAVSLTPVTPSSNQIQVSLPTNVNPCWTPLVVSQGSSSTKPMTPLGNIRLSVKQEKTGSKLISTTPPWTPLIVRQVSSSNLSKSLTLGCRSKASTSKAVPKFGLTVSTSKELHTIPAIVVSSKNAVPGQSPILLQIQRVKLVKGKPGDGKELKIKVMDDDPTIGKNKNVRTSTSTNVHDPTTCVSCKSNVEESLSPPKLQHLFTNETEVLRMCQKCLPKDGGEIEAETDEKQNESTGGNSQEIPGTSMDQGDLACTSKNNNQELEETLGDKSSTENLEDIGTLRDTEESVGIESADDVNNAQSVALNGTFRDNCESQGPQGTSSLFGEKVETVEPVEVLQEENLENDTARPLESLGGLVSSYQDIDSEFMLDGSDMIESAVPFVVESDGNFGPEAVDFLGIGDASLPEDNGVTKDNEELLGRYEAEGILKDILDAKENEELIKKSGGLIDFKVDSREERSNESSIEEVGNVVTTETSASTSQGEGEFSGIETAAITKNIEVDRNEELSEECICEEAGSSLNTCEEVLSERRGKGEKNGEGKRFGEEKNKGKSFRREEGEMKDNGESESERRDIGKEKNEGDGIGSEERKGKRIRKEEKNEGENTGREESDNEIEKNGEKVIAKEIMERKDNENQETVGKIVGKEINEGDSIGREESGRKDIGKEESIGKDIGKEEKNLGEEESKQESIGKEINERKSIGSGENERKEIEKEKNEEKSIGKEINEGKSIETEEKSTGKEQSGEREHKVVNEKIINEEEGISNEEKASGLKESPKNDSSGKRVKVAVKSTATENNAVKENDKRLRQRRTVATSKTSPAKSEKKIVAAKWHDKTRGALLKKQKEKEAVSETTQGVKRKNEKRPGRGKKGNVEDSVSNASHMETKASKEESTKDIKGSPSKRMKTRKELN